MTNLEAIKARVSYPLSAKAFELALVGRSLTTTGTFDASADQQAFDLAYADALTSLLTSPASVSEGGFSVSKSDRDTILGLITPIYNRYEVIIPTLKPTATFVRRW
jgi:hypothetical protein